MEFHVLSKNTWPPSIGRDTVYLKIDHWDDYGFVTTFQMSFHDDNGEIHEVGYIKIGFKGQTTGIDTYTKLPTQFAHVDEVFFSLGTSVDFYRNMASLPNQFGKRILFELRDIVLQPDLIDDIKEEDVFSTSLLRSVSLSVVKGQYARVLDGKAELTVEQFPNVVFEPILSCKCFFNSINKINAFKNLRNQLVAA